MLHSEGHPRLGESKWEVAVPFFEQGTVNALSGMT
jgi:hypothetical protein